jgi:hypothetical protein
MAGLGRNLLVGLPKMSKAMLRNQDRSNRVTRPKLVHHISALPPASVSAGQIYYVAGITKAHYFSNGSTWNAL